MVSVRITLLGGLDLHLVQIAYIPKGRKEIAWQSHVGAGFLMLVGLFREEQWQICRKHQQERKGIRRGWVEESHCYQATEFIHTFTQECQGILVFEVSSFQSKRFLHLPGE